MCEHSQINIFPFIDRNDSRVLLCTDRGHTATRISVHQVRNSTIKTFFKRIIVNRLTIALIRLPIRRSSEIDWCQRSVQMLYLGFLFETFQVWNPNRTLHPQWELFRFLFEHFWLQDPRKCASKFELILKLIYQFEFPNFETNWIAELAKFAWIHKNWDSLGEFRNLKIQSDQS